jgi:hypothetical protein
MEYVDGETLASLLRRIGRMPAEKAMDIARQLCAGLAAAHDVGVLHRDIKPSNIMIDGKGRARLMDFGLAVASGESLIGEIAGTPAYMAPEQVAGDRASEQTDVYALGLVLYELFTGRQLFPVRSIDERMRLGYDAPAIASGQEEFDPAVAAIVRSCLRRDPAGRPSSAAAVAAALPGGDSLAAAVAEGRLLSPDMVAAARKEGELPAALGWTLVAAVIAGLFVVAARAGDVTQIRAASLPKPPAVLAERAREILALAQHEGAPRDRAYWYVAELATDDGNRTPNAPVRRMRFVYRQSSSYLVPQNIFRRVTEADPPGTAGMATVTLDANGLLIRFDALPDQGRRRAANTTPGWATLFAEAGLRFDEFTEVEPERTPPVPFEELRAWRRHDADVQRVTTAALNGKPVYFERSERLPTSFSARGPFTTGRLPFSEALLWGSILLVFGIGAILARHNMRRGEGDRHGARRLSLFVIVGGVLMSILSAHHVPVPIEEVVWLISTAGWCLIWGGFVWLMYMAAEPFVRRLWPGTLISWTRLISGRLRDPLVGRDVLAGLVIGVALVAVRLAIAHQPVPNELLFPALYSLGSAPLFAHVVIWTIVEAIEYALAGLFFLLLLRAIVRRTWIAGAAFALLALPLITGGAVPTSWALTAYGLIVGLTTVVVVLRLGLLASAAAVAAQFLLIRLPITLDVGAWYFGSSALVLLLIAALATYGCIVAVALPVPFHRETKRHVPEAV